MASKEIMMGHLLDVVFGGGTACIDFFAITDLRKIQSQFYTLVLQGCMVYLPEKRGQEET